MILPGIYFLEHSFSWNTLPPRFYLMNPCLFILKESTQGLHLSIPHNFISLEPLFDVLDAAKSICSITFKFWVYSSGLWLSWQHLRGRDRVLLTLAPQILSKGWYSNVCEWMKEGMSEWSVVRSQCVAPHTPVSGERHFLAMVVLKDRQESPYPRLLSVLRQILSEVITVHQFSGKHDCWCSICPERNISLPTTSPTHERENRTMPSSSSSCPSCSPGPVWRLIMSMLARHQSVGKAARSFTV